ncbi:MAG: TetR/AcrR family transcriptional regulator [Butyricicoccus sp.]|nr:TetR/AcrR family transcriptional regulator [Butyricicoccus sp.]
MSNATKRILAMSLKKLLQTRALESITIQDLVDDAEVSRKTFYYHFRDVYDLLEWILIDDGRRLVEGNVAVGAWQKALRNIFAYFHENSAMIGNVYKSLRKDEYLLEVHVSRLLRPLLERVFDEQPGAGRVSAEDRQFILNLYSFGLVEFFLRWVGSGMKPEGNELANRIERIFTGSMENLIQKCI